MNVTSSPYNAKGDGVVLNDLTVNRGQTAISSQSAPFTTADAGKLVIWLTGATTEVGTIASVQSSSQATLKNAPVAGSVAFGGPNPNGAVGTDNTAAFNAAIKAAISKSVAGGWTKWPYTRVPQVHIQDGIYLVGALDPITAPGGFITGDGHHATILVPAITGGTMFSHGVFSTNPSGGIYGGNGDTNHGGYDWTYKDIGFLDAARRSEGNRTVTAIQDNGCGGIKLEGCSFDGFRYGFAGPYASDFSHIVRSFFSNCDQGAYFGPGSQQLLIARTDFTNNREGLVTEGAPHVVVTDSSSFEDNSLASYTIEAKSSGTTRFGLDPAVGGGFYSGLFLIDGGTWFETNSGNNGVVSERVVWFKGDGPYGQGSAGLTIRDAVFISGGQQASGKANVFVQHDTNYSLDGAVIVENLRVSDPAFINAVYKVTGNGQGKPILRYISRNRSKVSLTSGNAAPHVTELEA